MGVENKLLKIDNILTFALSATHAMNGDKTLQLHFTAVLRISMEDTNIIGRKQATRFLFFVVPGVPLGMCV